MRIGSRAFLPLLFFQIVIFVLHLQAGDPGWNSVGDYISHETLKNGLLIRSTNSSIRITAFEDQIFRVQLIRADRPLDDFSWSISEMPAGDERIQIRETESKLYLVSGEISVAVGKKPCRISFLNRHGAPLNEDSQSKGICWNEDEISVWKKMPPDEQYFGFGEKAGSLNKRGKALANWNTDIPAYKADTDPLYQTIPFFYGIRNGETHGIFFDNSHYSHFDMGKSNPDQYSFGATGGDFDYYFIYGPAPADVNRKFTGMTGRSPLPPRWSLGYQQCRWSYYPESKVREIASTFRDKKIPCDAIYLDIHYMDGYRCFTWDRVRFPNPGKMISELKQDGFKIVVIIDPGIKKDSSYRVYDEGVRGDYFVKYPDGKYFTGDVWPGECVFPDFINTGARQWWGTLYQGLVQEGVSGFWNDMNEPSVFNTRNKTFPPEAMHNRDGKISDHRGNHNVYGMQMARGTFEGLMKLNPGERPFVLTRANYAGGQRYAAAWTGDNISSWEHLEMSLPICLNLSISGQPFVGTDIGGFVGSPTGELYTRWLQFGTFTPLMRTHTEINSNDQEPWSFGPDYERINKKFIELRYKLLPYLYSQFHKAYKEGTPIIRPIFFDYPEDKQTYWSEREFLFGDAFLIAPVLWDGARKREIRLPEGIWYDYWTDEKISGPKYVTVEAPVDKIPVYVKGGSVIPSQQLVQYTDQRPIDTLTLDAYPGSDKITSLYEDDGRTQIYKEGEYSLREISLSSSDGRYQVGINKPEGRFRPSGRLIVLRMHDVAKSPRQIMLNGEEIPGSSWRFQKDEKLLTIETPDLFEEISFTIK